MAGLVSFLGKHCGNDNELIVSESRFDQAGHFAIGAIQGISTYNVNGSTLYVSPVRNNVQTTITTALGRQVLHAPSDIENDWIGFSTLGHVVIAKSITFSRLGMATLVPFEIVGTFKDTSGSVRGIGIVVGNDYTGNRSYGAGVHNQDISRNNFLFPDISTQHERHVGSVIALLDQFYAAMATRANRPSQWRPTTWDIKELFRVIGGFDEDGRPLTFSNRDATCGGLIYIKKVLHSSAKGICQDLSWNPATTSTATGYASAYNAWLYVHDYDNMNLVLETINDLMHDNLAVDSITGVWKVPDDVDRQLAATFEQ